MENSKSNSSEIMCQHCGKRIIAANFLLHEARCNLMSSRVRRQEDNVKQQRFPENNHSRRGRNTEIKPSISQRRPPEAERKKIFNEPVRSEEEDKIACSYCGYRQTFLELDTHPNECPSRGDPCTYCGQLFPEPLMNEHMQVCSARAPPHHANHIHEQDIHNFEDYGEQLEQDEDQRDYHPFGNFNIFFGGNQFGPGGRQPIFRRIQTINGRTVIEESDGRGGMIRRQTYDRQGDPSFRNADREQMFGSRRNGSPFSDFFRLLELMAVRSGQAEQGLTKDELKKLTKIKYKPGNSTAQKDLCTICYCQFEQDQRIIQLKCKHIYHEECIVKWLEKNAKCPVCKAPQTNRPINREQ